MRKVDPPHLLPGGWIVFVQGHPKAWLRTDLVISGVYSVPDTDIDRLFYFPTKEAAETAIIAAKIRGDAL